LSYSETLLVLAANTCFAWLPGGTATAMVIRTLLLTGWQVRAWCAEIKFDDLDFFSIRHGTW
jgi:hypothetical protein